MKHRKTKDSDKETTITAEEYAQILKHFLGLYLKFSTRLKDIKVQVILT
jgi:hypothetical protein